MNLDPREHGTVKILRDPQIISGFIYEGPIKEIAALTHCGEALCCRGHCRPSHSHPGFEFLYLSRGTCYWQTAGKSFEQKMGDLFIVPAGEPHRTGPRPNPENQHLWIGVRLEKLGTVGAELGRRIRRHETRLLANCQEAEPLLQAIIRQVMTLRPHRSEVVAALLNAFLSVVRQRLDMGADRPEAKTRRRLVPYSFAIQKAITYMERNLDRRIPLRDLASVATVRNGSRFCALFGSEVGTTPARFHARLRLQGAKEALRQPSATITHVALQYGFSSSQHFSTLFRQAFGMAPGQWQETGRQT